MEHASGTVFYRIMAVGSPNITPPPRREPPTREAPTMSIYEARKK